MEPAISVRMLQLADDGSEFGVGLRFQCRGPVFMEPVEGGSNPCAHQRLTVHPDQGERKTILADGKVAGGQDCVDVDRFGAFRDTERRRTGHDGEGQHDPN